MCGERSLTAIAAAFTDRARAESAAIALRRQIQRLATVAVVAPNDSDIACRKEPEQRGIRSTLVCSRLILGAAGTAGGLLMLRPDHGAVVRSMRTKRQVGQWCVVARPRTEAGAEQAFAALGKAAGSPVRSL